MGEGHSTSEQLPSGKLIVRACLENGQASEIHSYGNMDIAMAMTFQEGKKVDESYFLNRRMDGRKGYEKARADFPDMPAVDASLEDWGTGLLQDLRREQQKRKADAERRLAESAESQFPRPLSTNWLRVIAAENSHLVVFASRDWKLLARERDIPSGREWLSCFGFSGPKEGNLRIADGPITGYETAGDRLAMLQVSQALFPEVDAFLALPPVPPPWTGFPRPRPKPRKKPPCAWPTVLPPLIDYLKGIPDQQVKIFNHHR